MSRPTQRTQRPKKQKDQEAKEAESNTPTITQVPLTKYITHKDSPRIQSEQTTKENKKHKKNSGENPPDKRHHKSTEKIMSVNPQNREMINTQNTPLNEVPMPTVNTENLQKQLSAMEQRLSNNITNNVTITVTQNLQGTINSFDTALWTAMESMTSVVTRLIESNEAMIKHKETMDDLTQENRTLATRINRLENEHYKLKDRFDKIENKELEHSIILQGIEEQEEEDETNLTEYVYYELSYTIDSQNEHERWKQIKEIEITRCKRIGIFNHDRARPVKVEFKHHLDVEYILSNKRHLRWGVYADKAYTQEIESK